MGGGGGGGEESATILRVNITINVKKIAFGNKEHSTD